jgi:HK97 gp10 family phage protein
VTFESLAEEILEAATRALGEGAQLVAVRAKRHAPVRSIFGGTPPEEGFERDFRLSELRTERRILSRRGLKPTVTPRPTNLAPRWWRERRTAYAEAMLAHGMVERKRGAVLDPTNYVLSKRGASEVRSGRAKFGTWGHQYIGGRLRGEIFATPPSRTGSRAEAWVISPTRYAKYQEFGTRHNRAQPFLRPAAEESRSDVAALIGAAVGQAARTGAGPHETIEIVVRI